MCYSNIAKLTEGLDFDDVLLEPRLSNVNSREEVDTSVEINGLHLDIPIISSPMKGISSKELVCELGNLGGLGLLHRFYDSKQDLIKDLEFLNVNCRNYGASIGLEDYEPLDLLVDHNCKIICVDVANGYIKSLGKFCEHIKKKYPNIFLISGNVVTREGVDYLNDCGVDLVRVGIGGGRLCTTRTVTGVGIPQFSAVYECSYGIGNIVSDGGIRNSGDIVKALSAGADCVMIGSLFGQAWSASHDGIIYGMASKRLQEEYYHSIKSVEGIELEIRKTQTLESIVNELVWGIKSACTYLGAKNMLELLDQSYIRVKR